VTPSITSISTADAAAHIEAALIAQLEKTGCCTVVARGELGPLLATMLSGKPPVPGRTSAPPEDEVLPAQVVIAGSVTVYSPPNFGGGISESGPRRNHDSVEIEVRLTDARTAMVLDVFVADCRLDKFGERRGVAGEGDTADSFVASPVGQATNVALADIAAQISGALAALPWRGQIVKRDGRVVWVNAGSEDAVRVGDRFGVGRFGDALVDQDTGGVVNKVQLGVVTITNVEPRIASGAYRPSVAGDPARGDWLVLLPR
jgi:hypothetical protein